ncbi:alternate-type signal peptide domain-containing protein [Arthrobacter gandavensis]|uniref:alternate-type signal peptide domain-containing protein n=1 Tax=Arthrobacter gandavensis TaxID=169960 RepID=UPI00188F484E|nr:alternate-type signal peptide domain-containing protein [Arthrobacter gandavensis]MBF4993000.1 alternate-type signal peptide domain-containing protein [Arthrobacter gandavensis]
MAKGALATGVGVALLLGGGGTLAIWNDTANANTGNIVAGNMDINAGTAVWMKADGSVIENFASYRIVPGETLRFEQPVSISLTGDELKATLSPDYSKLSDGFRNQLTYSYSIVQDGKVLNPGTVLTEDNNGTATVTATVTFKSTAGNESMNYTQDLSSIKYVLQQIR